MQVLFDLYSKLHDNKDLTPEMFRHYIDNVKDVDNVWLLEVIYSFFMLGFRAKREYSPASP